MRSVAAKLAVVGLLSGFYVSLITPYLPIYLTGAGLTDAGAATVVAAMSLAQICVTGFFARRGVGRREGQKPVLLAEVATGVTTFSIALVLGLGPVLTVILFLGAKPSRRLLLPSPLRKRFSTPSFLVTPQDSFSGYRRRRSS